MHLSHLITGASGPDPVITGVLYDSRRIAPGNLFVAMRGETTDGNRFIDAAIQKGAVAVVTDSAAEAPRPGIAWKVVAHGRRALAEISAAFFRHPAQALKLVGVTGTNGKTTTSFLVETLLEKLGSPTPLLIGTIEYHVAGRVLPSPHTTPEALELQQMLAEAVHASPPARHAVMEVSSHALDQERVHGLHFEAAIFTNLTRDHLDYHQNMESYFASKQKLFTGLGAAPPKYAVINADDEYGRKLIDFARAQGSHVITYGIAAGDLRAEDIALDPLHTRFSFTEERGHHNVSSPLVGKVNVYNLLAAAAAAHTLGYKWHDIAPQLAACTRVPGRFERVTVGVQQPFTVVVDYAHTDDALRNLTSVAREFVALQKGRVITLFGCGGDRDKTKRPLMGRAAGEGSDFVVLTSDNPRSEDPMAIIRDAEPGVRESGTEYSIEPDRRKAIELAIRQARAGDIVLLAGKGHERTQTTRQGVHPFDDVAIAHDFLEQYLRTTSFSAPHTPSSQKEPAS